MNKALFLGASNTFGSGLHALNGEYNTVEKAKTLDQKILAGPRSQSEHDFVMNHRWSTKVANYLQREELNHSEAGGSPAESLYIMRHVVDLTHVDYIFFEFSNIYSYCERYWFHSDHSGKKPRTPGEIEKFLTDGKNDQPDLRERIKNWIINFDPVAFVDQTMKVLEQELSLPKMKNKKIVLLWWRNSDVLLDQLDSDRYEFFKKYAVKFPTPTDENNYIIHKFLMEKKLTVFHEHPLGQYMAHPDPHAGVAGNAVVADIIINHINEKEATNSW